MFYFLDAMQPPLSNHLELIVLGNLDMFALWKKVEFVNNFKNLNLAHL